MKKTALLAFVLTLLLSGLARTSVSVDFVGVSMAQEAAPDFTFTDIDGNAFSLNDYLGKVVLVEFFATWCSPCVNQTGNLKISYEEFGEKLVIISISPENETALRDFRDNYNISWTIAKDTADVFEAYEVHAIPTLVIIDLQGYICYTHVGLTEESVLRPEIESLLPKTIYVDDDNVVGPWNGTKENPYQNITSGIEHASDNDIVFVQNGTYYEHVTVNKMVSLIGENRTTTIIDGNNTGWYSGKDSVIYISAGNVTIGGFTVRNSGGNGMYSYVSGIYLFGGNCRVVDNIITDNNIGIFADGTSNNHIISNTMIQSNYLAGIYLSSSHNMITGNTITGHNLPVFCGGGVWLIAGSSNNTISNNRVLENWYGIRVCGWIPLGGATISAVSDVLQWETDSNIVSGNIVLDNTYALDVELSNNTSIVGNTITYNDLGLLMEGLDSDNTIVYHNNFIDNLKQVDLYVSYNNRWDDGYPSGGNYWSDYSATANDTFSGPFQNETGSDGIGDTAFTIDANNTDNYPLMGMFSSFNATSKYRVQTICNSSIFDFQFNGTAILFDVSGENDTAGFCRICIPKALMNETYSVFVNGTEVPCTLLLCSNSTHSYLYFTYDHSTQEVIIIPEFPSLIILALLMMTTLLAVAVLRGNSIKNRLKVLEKL